MIPKNEHVQEALKYCCLELLELEGFSEFGGFKGLRDSVGYKGLKDSRNLMGLID